MFKVKKNILSIDERDGNGKGKKYAITTNVSS